ncbi:MAG: hypothetical protein RJA70_2703 [Pseudomonadota bacterium]|jgi:hypothetical protein
MKPAYPHRPIQQVFDDVFVVTGTTRTRFMDLDWQYSRNMTVVRSGSDLCLINTVRLDEPTLAALDELGTVRHVVRLGSFHGMDDEFYLDRYGAVRGASQLWAFASMVHEHAVPTHVELHNGSPGPFPESVGFEFQTSKHPEGALLFAEHGGILVTCDSLQNWESADEFFDEESKSRMGAAGFFHSANVGPGFRAACSPEPADFEALLRLPFRHLLSAHGTPLLENAKTQVRQRLVELAIISP